MIQDVSRKVNQSPVDVLHDAPDEEVLAAALHDPDAFRILVRRYEAPFMRRAVHILRSREDAEEVVQDAFTRIYVYGSRYQPQEGASFSSWAYAILTRLCYTRYKKLAVRRKASVEPEPEVIERVADTDDFVERLSVKDEVLVALAKLPDSMARVLRLQFIEGKTQEEIAALTGSTVSAVKTRVHRAKKLFSDTYHDQHTD